MSKSYRSLCGSFSRTGAGLCIYYLFVLSNSNFLHTSELITLLTQSCLVLYSFWANLLHSLIMWLIVSSLLPHSLHLIVIIEIRLSFFFHRGKNRCQLPKLSHSFGVLLENRWQQATIACQPDKAMCVCVRVCVCVCVCVCLTALIKKWYWFYCNQIIWKKKRNKKVKKNVDMGSKAKIFSCITRQWLKFEFQNLYYYSDCLYFF